MQPRLTHSILFAILGLACTPHEQPADLVEPTLAPEPTPLPDRPPTPVVAEQGPGGCFAPARAYDIGFPPFLADVADVDRDGDLDLVASAILASHVAFIAGDGAGGFTVARRLEVEKGERIGVVLGDATGDDQVDLMMFDPHAGEARLQRGDGQGNFARSEPIELRRQVFGGVMHDLDGDGVLDLVAQHLRHLGVHRGLGDGRFEQVTVMPVGQAPEYVRVVDLDRDSSLDLVSASNDDGVLSRIHGTKPLQFGAEQRDRCGEGPHELAIADFDGDGRLDAAMATMHSHELCVFRQARNGRMALAVRVPLTIEGLDAADLDDDGVAELVIADSGADRLRVLALVGNELDERGSSTTGSRPHALWLRELDGDGRLDALMLDGYLAPEIHYQGLVSYEPLDTTVSVALGRACE